MRSILLSVLVAAAPYAMAVNELDPGSSTAELEAKFTKEQVMLSRGLPQTIVTRKNLKTGAVEVATVKEALAPGKKLPTNVKFETLAQNSEIKGVTTARELDGTSSTSSWWAVGGWGRGGGYGYGYGYGYYPRPYYPVAYGYGMGYAAGYYGANFCGGGYAYYCQPYAYPQVYCGGYGYGYAPYYGYQAGGYAVTYSGWGMY